MSYVWDRCSLSLGKENFESCTRGDWLWDRRKYVLGLEQVNLRQEELCLQQGGVKSGTERTRYGTEAGQISDKRGFSLGHEKLCIGHQRLCMRYETVCVGHDKLCMGQKQVKSGTGG